MRSGRTLAGVVVAIAILAASAAGQTPPAARPAPPARAPAETPPQEIVVRSWPDRTALWVGDRVVFTVEVDCAPTVDIVTDDLGKEKLTLEGLEVIDSTVDRVDGTGGRVTYRFRYRLTAYDALATRLQIGNVALRYGRRRAGQQVDEGVRAGEVVVPGATLALRSTIPEALGSVGMRDRRPLAGVPLLVKLARPVGIGLVLVSAAPLVVWIATLARRRQPKVRRGSTRAARGKSRQDLRDLGTISPSTEAERRDAYAKLDAVVRRHLASVTALPAEALTPSELGARLETIQNRFPRETVASLLEECERAKYGPPSLLPAGDSFRDALSNAEGVLAVTR